MTTAAEPGAQPAAAAATPDPTPAAVEEPAATAAKETTTTTAPATEATVAAVPAEAEAPTTAPLPAAASAPPPSVPQKAPAEDSTASAATAPASTAPEAPPPAAATAVPSVATETKLDGEKTQRPAAEVPASQKPGKDGIDEINPHDFSGEVQSNNDLPSAATLRKIENYTVLDRHGKSHTFRSLYAGRNVARRVLLIFVRHFFCGNCQEYLRTLSASITPEALLQLPISTFIAVVGCGDPGLIDMYVRETGCPFPVYADPTRRLYDELGMVRTLAMGQRPAYMRKSMLLSALSSVAQGLRQVPSGKATKAGDHRQIGGEFLFEPLTVHTPAPVEDDIDRRIGEHQLHGSSITRQTIGEGLSLKEDSGAVVAKKESSGATTPVAATATATATAAAAPPPPPPPPPAETSTTTPPAAVPANTTTSPNGATATSTTRETNGDAPRGSSVSGTRPTVQVPVQHDGADEDEGYIEDKQVTWCHRMRTTRDHAEIPELMEVLGLDGQGVPIKDNKRWSRALETRKGTGLSMAGQMSAISSNRGSGSVKSFDAPAPLASGKA